MGAHYGSRHARVLARVRVCVSVCAAQALPNKRAYPHRKRPARCRAAQLPDLARREGEAHRHAASHAGHCSQGKKHTYGLWRWRILCCCCAASGGAARRSARHKTRAPAALSTSHGTRQIRRLPVVELHTASARPVPLPGTSVGVLVGPAPGHSLRTDGTRRAPAHRHARHCSRNCADLGLTYCSLTTAVSRFMAFATCAASGAHEDFTPRAFLSHDLSCHCLPHITSSISIPNTASASTGKSTGLQTNRRPFSHGLPEPPSSSFRSSSSMRRGRVCRYLLPRRVVRTWHLTSCHAEESTLSVATPPKPPSGVVC